MSISYLMGFVRRQLRTIVAVALVVGFLCTLFVWTREAKFTSTTLLVIDGSALELTRGNQSFRLSQVDTEVELLRAITIVERLAKRLKFESEENGSTPATPSTNTVGDVLYPLRSVLALASEANGPAPVPAISQVVESVAAGTKLWREPQEPPPVLAFAKVSEAEGDSSVRMSSAELLALQKKFRIRRRGLTDVIAIEAKAKTPQGAAKLANLYAEVYLDEQVAAKLYSIERVEAALGKRIDELTAKLKLVGAPIALREVYNDYLSRLKEVRQKRSVIMPDMRVAAPALPLEIGAFPSSGLLLLLSWLLALGLGAVVAFLRDRHIILGLSASRNGKSL